jgi:aspartyl-tRNA(Asn)/glutamyl-tRNA(Gln) amidotransferase subunit C
MDVNDALIEKLSRLSRLDFKAGEKDAIKADLQKMISFIHKMEEVNTEGVAPLLHINEQVNSTREDIATGHISTPEALKNASVHDGSFFKVPKVIKKQHNN